MTFSPNLGRWLQADPLGLAPDTNLYRDEGDNPANATDPTGLTAVPQPEVGKEEPIKGKNQYGDWTFKLTKEGWNIKKAGWWYYAVDIKFSPDLDKVKATNIAFVQVVREVDVATKKKNLEEDPIRKARMTDTFHFVDKLKDNIYGWYGYNNEDEPERGLAFNGPNLKFVEMMDAPEWDKKGVEFQYETVAIVKAGQDAGKVLGSLTWGVSVADDEKGTITSLAREAHDKPDKSFAAAVAKWNEQAKGPVKDRNAEKQQPIMPAPKIPE